MTDNENIEAEVRVEPKKKKRGRKVLAILLVIVVLAAIGSLTVIYQNRQLEKAFYQVQSNKVIDNIRIVCLSDLHLREFGTGNKDLIDEIEKLSPDMIAIVGDMTLESQPDNYRPIISLCTNLKTIAPLYYALGNHEFDAMLFKDSDIFKDIKSAGINIMNNEMETVTIKGTNIDVIALSQGPAQFDLYGKQFFDRAMKSGDNFKLLLNHYPENFLGTLNEYEIDLALAGHVHGGQIRLPLIGGLYAADQGLLPKLCDGYYEIDNSKLVISKGLGWSGIIPRINNKPEITVVDIGWY